MDARLTDVRGPDGRLAGSYVPRGDAPTKTAEWHLRRLLSAAQDVLEQERQDSHGELRPVVLSTYPPMKYLLDAVADAEKFLKT